MNSEQPGQAASSTAPARTRAAWTWPDLLDLEFFFYQDRAESAAQLQERDHGIYADHIQTLGDSGAPHNIADRRWLIWQWLEARRKAFENPESLPGSLAWGTWRILVKAMALLGLVLGAGLAANLLKYDGLQPVNVAAYLGWLVMVQIGLVLLAAVVVVLRRTRILREEFSILGGLLRFVWSWLAARLHRHAMDRLPAKSRTQVQSFLGSLSAQQSIYGRVAPWPILSSLQRFGVFFNIGALAATVTLVMFSDRAFGWQSALNVSAEQIHGLVHTLAIPWSPFLPEAAGPSLEQIKGSKIILKEGIKQLATQNLVSWWPFLCLALVTYGLIPRLMLWMLVSWLGRRSMANLRFNQIACDRLHERLVGLQLQTSGSGAEPQRRDLPLDAPHALIATAGHGGGPSPSRLALIPQDLLSGLDQAAFLELVNGRFHWNLSRDQIQAWPDDSGGRDELLARLHPSTGSGSPSCLLLLDEAWQPPIAEKLSTLRDMRQAVGPETKIVLALVGRPRDQQILTPVSPSNWAVWERQISSLGDPQLRLEALVV